MTWSGDTSSGVTIVVSYYFKATTQKWSITSEISGTPKDVPGSYQKYLDDEWKIKPTNPEIKTLASEIMSDYETVYEKLDALAAWMRTNILYEKQRGWQPKDPLETLSDGTGDCDDQSILFASLARAQGIPVWLEMGALYDQYQKQWGGHAWLRAYVPLRTGGGMKVNMDPANKEFLVRDPFRITEWEADGDAAHFQNYYTLWSFSYSGYALYDAGADYVDTGFKRSTDTVSDKPAGSGIQAWQDSFRVPGFEFLMVVPAVGIGSLYLKRKLRT
jgi:transglutaminase-like putative cysteine protease